ncbi:MAG: hypothetical protein M0P69_12255 [Bacteroidales bacterium]|nr:hypothetical protein [Bacteroidales bacterium]
MNIFLKMLDRIVSKCTSGKFLCVIFSFSAFKLLLVKVLELYATGKVGNEVLLLIIGALSNMTTAIITFYFTKKILEKGE